MENTKKTNKTNKTLKLLKFENKEIRYIQRQMEELYNIYHDGTVEDVKELIHNITGEQLDTILFFEHNDWERLEKKNINEEKYMNHLVVEFLWEALGMWVWRENECETAEDVQEFVEDEMYCYLYQKCLDYFYMIEEDIEG